MTVCPRSSINCFILSVVVTLLLVPRLRASFRQIVWQAQKHPFLSTRASGSRSQPLLCARSVRGPVAVSCHQSLSWANTTGFVLKGDTCQLCPGVGGKTHVEAASGAGARTGVTLVSTKSYSCPALTPQRSPGAAWPQLEQLLCPNSQPEPENLAGRILQYAPWQ